MTTFLPFLTIMRRRGTGSRQVHIFAWDPVHIADVPAGDGVKAEQDQQALHSGFL